MRRIWIPAVVGTALALAVVGAGTIASQMAYAHCDTLDGPVVIEARAALDRGEVTPLLKWVGKAHEAEIKAAFGQALAVRAKGPEAKELADRYFFETLVRLHRAGEGAPYTGLKPAGQVAPPVAAADKAIADGRVDDLAREIGLAAEKGVRERFERVLAASKHRDESVEAGRKYVAAYVVFVHYVEGLHGTIGASNSHGHGAEESAEATAGHAH
jgi:hypothetical protein